MLVCLLTAAAALDAQGRRLCVAERLPIKAQRGKCCFERINPAGTRVALKHCQLLAFMCRTHVFLSNTNPPHYYLQFTPDEASTAQVCWIQTETSRENKNAAAGVWTRNSQSAAEPVASTGTNNPSWEVWNGGNKSNKAEMTCVVLNIPGIQFWLLVL